MRILHDDLKPFPYEIQILQRQTDQNKAELETFYEDISQRFEKDPSLLGLSNLNDVGLCGASSTLPVSRSLATEHLVVLLSGTLLLPKSLLYCRCVRRTDFVVQYASMIFIGCCVVIVQLDPYWCQKNRPGLLSKPPEKYEKQL